MRPNGNLINVSFSYNRPYKNAVDIKNFVRSEVDTEMRQVLTENIIKNAAPRRSKYYLSDGRGLLLEVNPNHSKYWIVRIYMGKKEIRQSIGAYPAVSLKEARMKAYEIKNLVRGLNPIMGAYTFIDNKKVKFWKVELKPITDEYKDTKNGTIVLADSKKGLEIKAKDGIIRVIELQGENGKKMLAEDYLRGNKVVQFTVLY